MLVQIYLRSCCVGEARTELVAAQSVKTGPGRCGSRCCTNPLYFPPQSTFHGLPRLFNERSCKTQWIWIWKRDLVRFRRNIGHLWVGCTLADSADIVNHLVQARRYFWNSSCLTSKPKFALFQPLGWRKLSGIAVQSFQELTHQAMPRARGLQTQSLMSILQNCADAAEV